MITKKTIRKITLFTVLSSSLLTHSSTNKVSANPANSVPISYITLNIGVDNNLMLAELIVPDRKTTIPAGGGLRRYDAHMAKMFELTHYECLDQQADRNWNGISWQYYAGNRDFDMGTFNISCSLARDIAAAYGLGYSEATPVTYYRADTTINVPKLNIVGGKISTWLRFTRNFKPVAQTSTVDDFALIRSVITQRTGHQTNVKPIHIVGNYAFVSYVYGHAGGQALLKKSNGQWNVITSDGGWIQEASYLMKYGVPRNIALELASGPDI